MRHCHEFGQCRSAQYGMIRRFEVGNFEFDELDAVVLPRAKGDWKDHRAKWMRCIPWDDAVVKRPPIREDLKVLLYQSQEADNTFITSDGTSPYNSSR
jgi:hypothetical protein